MYHRPGQIMEDTMTDDKRLLYKITDVARILGIPLYYIYGLVHDNAIPTVQIGKSKFIPRWWVEQVSYEANLVEEPITEWDAANYYYDAYDVARMMRLSTHTVYKLLRSGELPGTKIGKQWVLPKDKINAMIDALSGTDNEEDAQNEH